MTRIMGAVMGAFIFFLITNFGVWSYGSYGYSIEGFMLCYSLALPFFGNTLISTIIFSVIIELFISIVIFAKSNYLKYQQK
jgi:hypothetical protein